MSKLKATSIIFVATSFLAFGCKGSAPKASMPPLAIESAIATSKRIPDKIYFATSTEAIRSATIEPRVDGYLQSIEYSSGEPICKGDIIFNIDPSQILTDLYAAEAAMQSVQATLVEARNNYHRAIPLARIDAISASSLDQYTATYRAAEADLKSSEQSLKNAELNLSYTTISAPISGLIAETSATVGDYIGPGTKFETLTTISQIDTLIVTLAIPTSRYITYIGSSANSYDNSQLLSNITLILPDSSNYSHQGIYDYTLESASSNNSTIGIIAKIPNPNATLKSNMFARVVADIGEAKMRVLVPQRAITQMQGVSSVWVIGADSCVTFRSVELGGLFGDEWQVRSGLNAGERVATSGQLKLHEGAKITPISNSKQGR